MLWKVRSKLETLLDKICFVFNLQNSLFKANIKLPSRFHIPLLLKNKEFIAAEIGVYEGKFTEHILKNTNCSLIYAIDPWVHFEENKYIDKANEEQSIQDDRYNLTKSRLEKYPNRFKIIRELSHNAVEDFEDCSLDFIYIDGNHSYEGCKLDLECWWPKLKEGGLIAGDDYINGVIHCSNYGVKKAVDEFFKDKNIKINTTYKAISTHWPNWFVFK